MMAFAMAMATMMMLSSCKKEEEIEKPAAEEPNINAEMIVGNWNLDSVDTYVVRIYTSAIGESSADTIPLSSGGKTMVYSFASNGVLTLTTTASDGATDVKTFDYRIEGDKLIFDKIEHFIMTLNEQKLDFEQRQHMDYQSGEKLDYIIHYSTNRQQES